MLNLKYPGKRGTYYNIFQSFAKRIEFCDIYYAQFEKMTTKEKIKDEYEASFTSRGSDGIDYRVYYESATLSFLQNIHALCDSVSFSINEIAMDKHKIQGVVHWDTLLEKIDEEYQGDTRLNIAVSDLRNDNDFMKLRGYVNSAKHSHMVNIVNYGDRLVLDSFSYWDGKEKIPSGQEELFQFMLRIHKDLVGKIMNIYNLMLEIIKEKNI